MFNLAMPASRSSVPLLFRISSVPYHHLATIFLLPRTQIAHRNSTICLSILSTVLCKIHRRQHISTFFGASNTDLHAGDKEVVVHLVKTVSTTLNGILADCILCLTCQCLAKSYIAEIDFSSEVKRLSEPWPWITRQTLMIEFGSTATIVSG